MPRRKQELRENKYKLKVIAELLRVPNTSNQVSKNLGMAQSTIFVHIQELFNDGYLLETDKKGVYSVNLEKLRVELKPKIEDLQNELEFYRGLVR